MVGYDNGCVEVIQIHPQKLVKLQQLAGLTTAGVNQIKSQQINGLQYYYVATNDSLYIYESNLVIRNCFKCVNQGVSQFIFKTTTIKDSIIKIDERTNEEVPAQGATLQIVDTQQKKQFSNV